MIAKKKGSHELQKRRNSLLQIGLLTSTSLALAAFTYQTPVDRNLDDHQFSSAKDEVEYRFEEPEKEKVKEKVKDEPVIEQTQKDITDPNTDLGSSSLENIVDTQNGDKVEGPVVIGITIGTPPGGGKIIEEPIEIVDVEAEFPGGYIAMMNFINENIDYPADALELGKQGKLFVSFVVEKDGSISNVSVPKEAKIYPSIDAEAKRLVGIFPKWKPGEKDLEIVRTKVVLPIKFVIGQ